LAVPTIKNISSVKSRLKALAVWVAVFESLRVSLVLIALAKNKKYVPKPKLVITPPQFHKLFVTAEVFGLKRFFDPLLSYYVITQTQLCSSFSKLLKIKNFNKNHFYPFIKAFRCISGLRIRCPVLQHPSSWDLVIGCLLHGLIFITRPETTAFRPYFLLYLVVNLGLGVEFVSNTLYILGVSKIIKIKSIHVKIYLHWYA
jgi:hypothetical protein